MLSCTFYRIWTSAKPRPIPNVIRLSRGLHHVSINVYAKFHHNIPLSSRDRDIVIFSEFELGKASTGEKCHFAISWARSCQYQCLRKSLSKYSIQFKRAIFTFCRIWTSATPRPIPNDIWWALGLHLVNINAYSKFYQNIPNGLRVIDIFHEQVGDKIKCLKLECTLFWFLEKNEKGSRSFDWIMGLELRQTTRTNIWDSTGIRSC